MGVHTTGFVPVQTPVWHVSVRVQALLSLQTVPSALAEFAQAPVAGSQMPAV
jgi:hypothetical protein